MAILDFNSTIRTTAGGQTTSAIITAANIGNYGISTTSTYYIGTTQNVFNRASGAQTLTGVSIDGNAATVTNGLTTTNYSSYALPISGGTMTGVLQSNKPINASGATYGSQATYVGNWSGTGWWGLGSESGHILKFDQVAYADVNSPTWIGATDLALKLGTKFVRDSYYRTISGIGDYYASGASGWYTVASITLTTNCTGGVLYGTLYDHRYDGADAYQISIVARAECDFQTNNESHYVNVGCTILGSTNITNYQSKIRVLLVASSANSRTYEVQFLETAWNRDTWQLETSGSPAWTIYSTAQAPGTSTGTARVFYISNKNADNIRANTASYSPVYYDSANTAYYIDPASTSIVNSFKVYDALYFGDYTTYLSQATPYLRITTANGYGNFGPANSSWFHMTTDRPNFYMAVGLHINGDLFIYNTQSQLTSTSVRAPIFYDSGDTTYYLDPANTGTSLLVAGKVGIGITSPLLKLQVDAAPGNPATTGTTQNGIFRISNSTDNAVLDFGMRAAGAGAWLQSTDETSLAANYPLLLNPNGANVGINNLSADTNLQVVGHVHVGNQTTFENTGGWNKTIYLDGTIHARMRILGSAYASGKNSATETSIWVDNSVAPYSGLTTNAGSFTINAGFTTLTNSARSPIFYDSDDTNYYGDFASTSRLNILNLVSYGYINGQTLNGQSFYQWEGATYRNPADHTPQLLIRKDNTTTGINGFAPALALYNNNGADQTTVGMAFVSAEAVSPTQGNAVELAGIIAKKELAGTAGAWTRGSLNFYTKDNATRKDVMYMSPDGTVTVTGTDNNSGKADFSVDTAGTATMALSGQYFRVGSTDVNWSIKMQNDGYIATWAQQMRFSTDSGDNAITFATNSVNRMNIGGSTTETVKITGYANYIGNYGYNTLTLIDTSGYPGLNYRSGNNNWLMRMDGGGTYSMNWSSNASAKDVGTFTTPFYFGTTGTAYASNDFRAPIFYDANDTNYYLDPAATSNILELKTNKTWYDSSASSWGGGINMSGNNPTIGFQSTSSTWWYMLHHASSAINFYRRSTSGSWNQDGIWDSAGNFIWQGSSVRGQVFYDNNDTGYYCDPASTSRLNTINVGASGVVINNASTAAERNLKIKATGSGNGSGVGIALYDSSDTFRCQIYGETSNYGFLDSVWGGWDIRKTISGSLFLNNNTTYYLNPASTTNLNTVNSVSLNGNYIGVSNTTNTNGYGISLYNGAVAGEPTYGLMFQGTATFGTHGSVTSDWATYFTMNNSDTRGWIFRKVGTANIASISGSGVITASGDMRAPVFYDSANTAYYCDPNGVSNLYGVAIRGDVASTNTDNQIFFWGTGNTTTSAIGFKSNGGAFTNPTGYGDGYNTYFTMDSDGRGWVFRRGTGGTDFTAAYTSGWILNNGIWQANASMRSPIFYDSNNTSYYLDAANSGTSLLVAGNVGIGTTSPSYKLQVVGSFAATTKSFNIEHPTKPNARLIYGSLESPYHGIRLTGKGTLINGSCKVNLPDYIYKLVREESVSIHLTGVKCGKVLYVDEINVKENYFTVTYDKTMFENYKNYEFFWDFTAIRSDVPELITEA